MPKVSIVIPTYNRAYCINRAIESVLAQTYRDFEIIVVDDGSTDNTYEVIQGFKDERIKYIKHSHNKSESAARNTGIKNSLCEYIAFQDSDDEWLPEKLERQMMMAEEAGDEVGVIYSQYRRVLEDGRDFIIPHDGIPMVDGDIQKMLLESCIVGMPTTIVRRNCFERVGLFDESIHCCTDWDMWLRISGDYKFAYLPEVQVISYVQGDSLSAENNLYNRAEAYEIIMNKHHEAFSTNKRALTINHMLMGRMMCCTGHMKRGRVHMLKALAIEPFNLIVMKFLVLSLLGRRAFIWVLKTREAYKDKARHKRAAHVRG